MLATILIHLPLVLVPVLSQPPTGSCQFDVLTPQALEERAVTRFNGAVQEYVTLHRRLARTVAPDEMFDEEGWFAGEAVLREALIAARPGARQGQFFTPGVAQVIRDRIDEALLRRVHHPGDQALARLDGDENLWIPAVNEPFPSRLEATAWPVLVQELPALPRELDYAVWGRALVLVDVSANLVIDVLPDALPAGGTLGTTYQ
jgi:hypothetical protein